jgi:hypothetical protein
MSRRFTPLFAAAGIAATIGALLIPGGAGAAGSLPTMKIALKGTTGVKVSGQTVSGAVSVVTTFKGQAPSGPNSNGPGVGIIRLNPGVSPQQAIKAVNSHHGDLNALDPYGALIMSASAPSAVEVVLTPGSNYYAINETGNGQPGVTRFTVRKSASPAALPAAKSTQTAIEFGFRGSKVLHDGTMVRARNGGYLVHMNVMIGVRDAATGRRLMAALRAGNDRQAQKLTNRRTVGLMGPVSPGAVQQEVLHAKPGWYVEACFMDTQDGREHTRLGMERLVHVVR